MALRKIESFVLDGAPDLTKAAKKGYSNLTKAAMALGSDDITGVSETNHIYFSSPGRYNDGQQINILSVDEYIEQGCPSCAFDYANFGSYLKIPIPETSLDTYGVVGFSVYFNQLPNALISNLFKDDSNNDGIVFFGLGSNGLNNTQIVCGVRASDDKMYIKVLDTAVSFAVSTGLTGTNSDKYRGYHNNNGTCTISNITTTTGVWYTVEIKYKFSATAGHVLLYVNGVKVAETATNIAFNTTYRDAVYLSAMYSLVTANPPSPESISDINNYFDDFYMLDSTGSKNSDYLGNYRVRSTSPSVNYINEGYATTTEYLAMQSDDNDSSYVSIQSGERQVFEVTDIDDISTRIRGIQYNFLTYFENNDDIRIIPLSEHGGVLHSGYVNQIPVSGGGWIYHNVPIESSLVTGGDWTLSEINDGYHGFTILS